MELCDRYRLHDIRALKLWRQERKVFWDNSLYAAFSNLEKPEAYEKNRRLVELARRARKQADDISARLQKQSRQSYFAKA